MRGYWCVSGLALELWTWKGSIYLARSSCDNFNPCSSFQLRSSLVGGNEIMETAVMYSSTFHKISEVFDQSNWRQFYSQLELRFEIVISNQAVTTKWTCGLGVDLIVIHNDIFVGGITFCQFWHTRKNCPWLVSSIFEPLCPQLMASPDVRITASPLACLKATDFEPNTCSGITDDTTPESSSCFNWTASANEKMIKV
jgi:hypothetical protein